MLKGSELTVNRIAVVRGRKPGVPGDKPVKRNVVSLDAGERLKRGPPR
jgi:hypothetical protein